MTAPLLIFTHRNAKKTPRELHLGTISVENVI